jgi:hypothetical protein
MIFTSANSKLRRAAMHLEGLRQANTSLTAANGGSWLGVVDLRPGEQALVGRPTQPDVEWSLLIGDCIQNLRAALDHRVWELASEAVRKRSPSAPEFPIFLNARGYTAERHRRIGSIPSSAAAVIDRMQPFATTEPKADPLWLLHDLARIDRHRQIHVVAMAVQASVLDADQSTHGFDPPMRLLGPGTVHTVTFAATAPSSNVQAKLHLAVEVVFDDAGPANGLPVLRTLDVIVDRVRDILERLRPFTIRQHA